MVQADQELFEILRELRSAIAARKRCPAYVVFPDKTLLEISLKYPTTSEELGKIYGVGKTKLSQYGEEFLEVVNRYIDEKKAEGVELPYDFAAPLQKDNGVDNIQIAITPINQTSIYIENFGEIRERLDYFLDFYRNAAYTPENLYQAIQDKASLNKLKKALKVKEKEIKDTCLEPYKAVQFQFKDLVAMIDEPLTSIAEFTSEMEQVRKDEKCAEIKVFYNNNAFELGSIAADVFSSPWFYNSRWENKTYSEQKWQREVETKINEARESIQEIRDIAGPHTPAVIAKYVETGSVSEAKEFLQTLTSIAEEEQKNPAASTFEMHGLKEEHARSADQTYPVIEPVQSDAIGEEHEAPQMLDVILKLRLSEKQFQLMQDFMHLNKIDYEIVLKT